MKSSEFKLLVMPYSSRLFRMAYRLMNNREEAEDLLQETFLRVVRARERFERRQQREQKRADAEAEETFEREVAAMKDRDRLLEEKFREALKRAEEEPEDVPPPRPWDLD